jgi:hypothetical protein
MGSISFHLPRGLTPAEEACLPLAALAGGYDVAPTPTRRVTANNIVTLTKDANESSYLMMPWPLSGSNLEMCLSTTLRERQEPYHLLTEMARGKVNQLRCQVYDWQAIGLATEEQDSREIRELTRLFGTAVRDPEDPDANASATEALIRAQRAGERLSAAFAEQLLETRLNESGPLETRTAIALSTLPSPEHRAGIAAAFTSVKLTPVWADIEPKESEHRWEEFDSLVDWAFQSNLDVAIGPIIDLNDGQFPDWVKNWSGKPLHLATFFNDFVSSVVKRYQSRVRSYQVCSGFNHQDAFTLGEDDRLNLAAKLFDTARNIDPDCSWTLGIVQPWGDYLVQDENTYSPLVFADTLIRAGFQFAAVELEVLSHARKLPSYPRDSIALYRLTELFGLLSLPLEICFNPATESAGSNLTFAVSSGLAVALPQVRGICCDFARRGSPRNGENIPPEWKAHLRELRVRYLA